MSTSTKTSASDQTESSVDLCDDNKKSSSVLFSLIVAMAKNGVIGINNTLPWRLPADLAYFKSITLGKPIVMGRKTFDSIGRPLPGRTNIVVTRQPGWSHQGVEVVDSLEAAIDRAKKAAAEGPGEAVLIGGADLYRQAIKICDKMYLTEVDCNVHGDAFFPNFNRDGWRETSRVHSGEDDKNAYACDFLVLERKK